MRTGYPFTLPRLSRGSGATVLDFLHVDDAVDGLLALANHLVSPGRSRNHAEVFNFGIGEGHALTMRELVRKISECFDGKPRDLQTPAQPSEPVIVKYLDAQKAYEELLQNPELKAEEAQTIQSHYEDLNMKIFWIPKRRTISIVKPRDCWRKS